MPLPPFGVALVVYISCGGLLWFTAYMLAPVGYQISLWRGVGAAILSSIASVFLPELLNPLIGGWYMLALFAVHILIVKSVLWLPFWRSLLTVVIYWVVLVAAYYVLFESPLAKGRRTASVPVSILIILSL
jgi:hypothetical protein